MDSGSSRPLDLTFAYNDAMFSDRTLRIEIIPESTVSRTDHTDSLADLALTTNRKRRCPDQDYNIHEAVQSNDNQSSTAETRVKNIYITTAILAAHSPFFLKLFTNGMSESNKQLVTLQIQESEEAAFMDMLKFMYTNTLLDATPATLLAILIVADKYEVASCMKYCLRLLPKSPMTCELAVLYLDLPQTILMDDTARPLTDAAKEILVEHFKDISQFQEEMLNLPLTAIEAILSHDDLQVDSEDKIYDFVMKWAQSHYTNHCELQEILNTRLLRLIRFQYMSCDKLKELLSCAYIDHKCSFNLIYEALSFETSHRQLSLVSSKKERAYNLRPVKVITFDSPQEECVVYLDLKRDECTHLFPNGRIRSRDFHFGGKEFFLQAKCSMDDSDIRAHESGFYLGMRGNRSAVIKLEFSAREKPSGKFVSQKETEHYNVLFGYENLFGVPWDRFIADDSPYFINGLLHLRATIVICSD